MEVVVDEFPFAANALRRAEATVYPEPYVTPWTRIYQEGWFQKTAAVAQENIRRHAEWVRPKITAEIAVEMKRLRDVEGMTQTEIAEIFNCSQHAVSYHVGDNQANPANRRVA